MPTVEFEGNTYNVDEDGFIDDYSNWNEAWMRHVKQSEGIEELTDEHKLKSIAFPAISTGIFGYPLESCARIMLAAVIEYLRGLTGLQHVLFCLFDAAGYAAFEEELMKHYPDDK